MLPAEGLEESRALSLPCFCSLATFAMLVCIPPSLTVSWWEEGLWDG